MFKASVVSSDYNLSGIASDAKNFGTDLQAL
jgi:hypothetical protein